MKKLFLAGIIGMTIFQSCTKESNIIPQPQSGQSNSLQRLVQPLTPKPEIPESKITIIKCGTVIPGSKREIQPYSPEKPTPPIYIPKLETKSH